MYNVTENENLIQMKNLILLLLIIIDLIFIVSITAFTLPIDDIEFMAYFDLFVCIVLFINIIFEYRQSKESLGTFIKSHIVDLISIIPFNFIFLRYLTVFRLFRILQILQVIRVVNLKQTDIYSFRYFVQNQLLKTLTVVLVIYMVITSIILFVIDPSFFSIFDSFWYNVATVTGVGYGDFTPITGYGKIIGILSIIIGVLFISVFTAAMSGVYMEKTENETRKLVIEHNNHIEEENKKLKQEIDELHKKIDHLTELIED